MQAKLSITGSTTGAHETENLHSATRKILPIGSDLKPAKEEGITVKVLK